MKKIGYILMLFLVLPLQIMSENINSLLRKANKGDAEAQNELARIYSKGEGVEKNDSLAFYWYQKAADQGHAGAQNGLGYMYLNGFGTTKDYSQAIYWFRKAVKQGYSKAEFNLGAAYIEGWGVVQNYDSAFYWFQKAANQGYAKAQGSIGYMYSEGLGRPVDMTQAVIWYRKSAEQGENTAQYNLAVHYYYGEGVTKDYKQAFHWFQKAADQGDVDAQYWMASLYERGHGVDMNLKKAYIWYLKAAEHGNAKAQYAIGMMYYEGKAVPKDYKQTFQWYQKAADQGHAGAQNSLGYLYTNGYGVSKNHKQAVYWWRQAAAKGEKHAIYNLGYAYRNGYGVEKDLSKAMMWYKRSADLGYITAKEEYEKLRAQGYKEAEEQPVQPPLLSLVEGSLEFVDPSQNNRIDANEQCYVRFKIENTGKGLATDCKAKIQISGNSAGINVSSVDLPSIGVGRTCDVSIPITSDINTIDGNVQFSIEVYEPNGWGIAPFDLTVATKAYEPPYLQVVDYNISSASGKIKKMDPFSLTFNVQNTKYGDADDVTIKVKLPYNIFVMDGKAETSFPLIKSGEAKSVSLTLAANNNYPTTNIPITIDIKEKHGKFAENKQLNIALNQTASSTINIAAKDEPEQERKEIQLAMMTAEVDRNIPVSKTKNANTFVLIIANENYQSVAAVPYALNDGKIFRQYCEQTLGVPAKNIREVSNATGNQIKAQINWLQNVVEVFDNPNIIFYYAGHGIPDEASKTAYLLPVDGSGTDVSTGYKLDDLYAALGKMPASHITVFMDACFSGSKREEGMLASARGVALKAKSGVPQGNMVVFSAAQGNETAYPNKDKQHGMFTYYLLKKLQETEGNVSLQELGDYIITNVKQQSILQNSKLQTPCVTPAASLGTEWQSWKLK